MNRRLNLHDHQFYNGRKQKYEEINSSKKRIVLKNWTCLNDVKRFSKAPAVAYFRFKLEKYPVVLKLHQRVSESLGLQSLVKSRRYL